MTRLRPLLICALWLCASWAVSGGLTQANAARHALVVGNDTYQNIPELQKAQNDARSIAGVLETLGFRVDLGLDLTRRQMSRKLSALEGRVQPGDEVFFFFAGHGVAIGAENYLLPVDVPRPGHGELGIVRDESHGADAIVRRIQGAGAKVAFVVLDACRDNPFAATGTRSVGAQRGLTRLEAPSGVFVLFSAGIGQSALDSLPGQDPDPNSVFTRSLLPLLETPGLSHVDIAKRVQQDVATLASSVRHPQQPAYYDQILGEVILSAALPGAAAGRQPRPVTPDATPPVTPTPQFEGELAQMRLPAGVVTIRLRPDLAPNHVARFRELAARDFYKDITFHRVISGFVAQAGDPTGTGTGGSNLPDLKAEFSDEPFKRGTLAAARAADPDSANSQFFICFTTRSCGQLTGHYTVWGEVVDGMEHVDALKPGDPGSGYDGEADRITSFAPID